MYLAQTTFGSLHTGSYSTPVMLVLDLGISLEGQVLVNITAQHYALPTRICQVVTSCMCSNVSRVIGFVTDSTPQRPFFLSFFLWSQQNAAVLHQHSESRSCQSFQRPRVVTCEIKLFQNYFSLRRRPSEIYFSAWKLALNYFKIISQAYCSSRIFSNTFIVAEIISK